MTTIQKYIYKTQFIMLFLIPLWVAMGRSLFGAGGWLFLITLFVLGPLLFLGLLIAFVLTRKRSDIKNQRSMPVVDTVLLSITYLGSLIFGFFIEDGGDTKESVGSAASKLFNIESSDSLHYLASTSMLIALVSLGVLIIYNVYKLGKK